VLFKGNKKIEMNQLYKLRKKYANHFAKIVEGTTYNPRAQVMTWEEWKDFLWKNDEFEPVGDYIEPIGIHLDK
jgi:hypothetical protein